MNERDGTARRTVVVGGGPAGVLATYLLARAGHPVVLLEKGRDFARSFRGDTLSPQVLNLLDRLGVADELLAEVGHTRAGGFTWNAAGRAHRVADYRWSRSRFPFYVLMPQERFLSWFAARAEELGARVLLGRRLTDLVRDRAGRVRGVRSVDPGGATEQHDADVVVAGDGRWSRARLLSGIEEIRLGGSVEILWFEVPREPGDPQLCGLDLFGVPGATIACLDRGATWQLGYSVAAGRARPLRREEPARVLGDLVDAFPWFEDRCRLLDPGRAPVFPVKVSAAARWTTEGLLLVGDAAHSMSPIGGYGVDLAIGDAVEAVNGLVPVLRNGARPGEVDAALRLVERRRRPTADLLQWIQVRAEQSAARRLASGRPDAPWGVRLVAAVPCLPEALGVLTAFVNPIPAPSDAVRAVPWTIASNGSS